MRYTLLRSMVAVVAVLQATALPPAALAQEAEAPQVPVFRVGGALGVGNA
jgi:hypothetical protein